MRAPVVAPAPVLVSVEAALVVAGGDWVALVVGAGRGRVVGRVGGGVVGGPRSQGPQVLAIVPGVSVPVSRSVPVLKVRLKYVSRSKAVIM